MMNLWLTSINNMMLIYGVYDEPVANINKQYDVDL